MKRLDYRGQKGQKEEQLVGCGQERGTEGQHWNLQYRWAEGGSSFSSKHFLLL